MSERTVRVDWLTRVEGEGALDVTVHKGHVQRVRLRIYEPPRFFESFLRGRNYREPPDLTARVCGICPVAYQMSAALAIEQACGVTVDGQLAALRRLLYCGEWIASHALHIYLLHAPDFLRLPDAITLARQHRRILERGLALKKAGNTVMELVGGRAIHPINVRLGGFYRLPTVVELMRLRATLVDALDHAVSTVQWVAGFDFPEAELPYELLALHQPGEYAIDRGVLRTSSGREFAVTEFGEHVVERQAPHSTALQSTLDGRPFVVGPLARYSLNWRWLHPLAQMWAAQARLGPVCRNPFRSIVVRAVEIVHAIVEAIRIIDQYTPPAAAHVKVLPRPGAGHSVGYGATEAPRGVLYHRYELDPAGTVTAATIVPPTAQNQLAIEDDLRHLIEARLHLDDAALTALCERAIRNYDPCISCATHFLTLTMVRS